MIISELFHWLHVNEEALPSSNPPLSRDLLQTEQEQAKIANRKLVAKIRLAKLSGQETEHFINELDQHNVFMNYLEFCQLQLAEGVDSSLFLITFQYLLSKSQQEVPYLGSKWNELFFALLQVDKNKALSLYQDNEALFKNHPEIQKQVALELEIQKRDEERKRVEHHLSHLSEQLSAQKNPLGVIGLCREWIGDTELFAALILWLVRRNVSEQHILHTYLLHDFLKYHLFTLYSEDNEVFRLYALLNCFPEAKQLIDTAQQISSDEEAFRQYALDGTLSKGELENIARTVNPLQFSLTPSNFLALHQLFGQQFLIAAITAVEEKNAPWLHILGHTLNQPPTIVQGLSTIINVIARETSPRALEYLAHLIKDDTAQQLLAHNEGAVFYLLPYKPNLFEHINEENVAHFIQHITVGHTAEPDIIFQLMALFSMLSKKNSPLTQLVFEAILDNLALHPMLLDDDKLVRQLRKYPDCETIIKRKSEQAKQQLNQCIIEQTSEPALSSHNHHLIEDTWLDTTRKLAVFDLIKPQAKFLLDNKYALRAKTAEIAFRCHGVHFDLNTFIEALSLPPVVTDEVSEYERVLVELLAVIDNGPIRKQIIQRLEDAPVQRLNWAEKEYEGKTIFIKAAQQGNLGLITLLAEQIAPEAWSKAIRAATKANQWPAVDYLCRHNKVQLSSDGLVKIIFLAAGQGQLHIIKYLLKTYDYAPSSTELLKILNEAITNNQLHIIQFFYSSAENMPRQSEINKQFHTAVALGHWDIALFMAHSEQHPPSIAAIEKAFHQAVNTLQLEAISKLYHATNPPRASLIQRVFVKACEDGHLPLVRCLHQLPVKLPPDILGEALAQASINEHMDIISYLCNSSINAPNQNSVNQGLIAAAKSGKQAPIEFFCSMSTQNKPSKHSINHAVQETVKNNQLETFIALCHIPQNLPGRLAMIRDGFLLAARVGRLNIIEYVGTYEMDVLKQQVVGKALIAAVKNNKPEIVRYLCELPINTLEKKSLRVAIKKAVASGQTDVADYLSERLHGKAIQKKTDTEFDSPTTDNDSELGSVLELDNDSEIDVGITSDATVDNRVETDKRLTIDNSQEIEPEVVSRQNNEAGVSLQKHGLFKTKGQQNIRTPPADLIGTHVLR